jgi:hypothetical protein
MNFLVSLHAEYTNFTNSSETFIRYDVELLSFLMSEPGGPWHLIVWCQTSFIWPYIEGICMKYEKLTQFVETRMAECDEAK